MTTLDAERPGGEMASRPLHFIWLADCSASMQTQGKIQALNEAIREATPHMIEAADENPQAEVLVRAIKFSSSAQWHISQPTPVHEFSWQDLQTEGCTAMGEALSMVAEQMKIPPMTDRALPPVLVLISDGHPTDNFTQGLKDLFAQPWGQKAVRLAIPIGDDQNLETLRRFISNPEIEPIPAKNAEQLKAQIKFFSTAVLKSVANSPSMQEGDNGRNVIIPDNVSLSPVLAGDVW